MADRHRRGTPAGGRPSGPSVGIALVVALASVASLLALPPVGAVPVPPGPVVARGPLPGLMPSIGVPIASTPGGDLAPGLVAGEPAPEGDHAPTLPVPVVMPPPGQIVARLSTGNTPQGVAYDPWNGWMYVTNTVSNSVTVFNGTRTMGTVNLGSGKYPTAAAYNPRNGDIYVTDYSANSVSVINGTSLVTTISNIGTGPTAGPYAIAYHPGSGTMYVTEYNAVRVAVISGFTVTANITVLAGPDAIVYNNANLEMYVACNTAGYVSVLQGTTVVASVRVGSQPQGLAYDSTSGNVYVANSASNTVMIINSTNKVVATIPVAGSPVGEVFAPSNGYVYVVAYSGQNLTAINGSTVVGQIATALHPYNAAYDALTGCLYVTEQGQNTVALVSTRLVEGPIAATPIGSPAFSADVNQTVTLNASFWYIGAGSPTGSATVSPASGLGCPVSPVVSFVGGVGGLAWGCHPTNATTYTIVMNVTDPGGLTVSSSVRFHVYADPVAAPPQVDIGTRTGLTMADVGQLVNFSETATLGTGVYPSYLWETFPIGMCSQTNTSQPVCLFTREFPTPLDIKVIVTDSNGMSSTSPSIHLVVNVMPTAGDPSVNRTLADVGQALDFTTTVAGGSDAFTFSWIGLPDGCIGVTTATPHCVPRTAGTYSVSVQVTDAVGGVSPRTSSLSVTVFADPKVGSITASPSAVVLGNPVLITATVSGGWGNYTYNWTGLPPGCSGHGVTISCRPTRLGTYTLGLAVTDENGFVARSGAATVKVVNQTVAPPSGPGGALPTLFGMPPLVFYGLFGTLGLAVVVIGVALIVRSRRAFRMAEADAPVPPAGRAPPPEGTPAEATEEVPPEEPEESLADGAVEPPLEES